MYERPEIYCLLNQTYALEVGDLRMSGNGHGMIITPKVIYGIIIDKRGNDIFKDTFIVDSQTSHNLDIIAAEEYSKLLVK